MPPPSPSPLQTMASWGVGSLDLAFERDRVAIEVDGPTHFAANRRRHALGHTRFKRRILRALGWAVVSVPLTFNLIYMLGFSNNLVAAPLLVLSVPVFYRYLERPSWRRWLGVALLVLLVFMAHAQVFLWTGVLLATLTVYMALRAGADRWSKEGPLLAVLKVLACSFAAVVPALLCFGRWYYRTFVHVTGPQLALAGPKDSFGAVFIAPENVWNGLLVSQRVMKNPEALKQQWALVVLLALALVLARFYRWAKPPILEAAFFLSLVSYFLLPENLTGQDILASRQISVALWFSAVLFTPIPARVSRFAHWAVVAGILAWSGAHLRLWSQELAKFEAKEAHGLDEVMMAAPPRLAIHYVKDDPESEFFYARPFWHVEKWYMSEKLGRGDDTTGVQANGTIRFREGVVAHRGIGEGPTWVRSAELWDNFDLVLLRRRSPRPEERAELEKRAYLLSRVGDWEMWRKRPAP